MVKCDRQSCREMSHLYCFNEDKKESMMLETSSSQNAVSGWEISHKDLCSNLFHKKQAELGIEGTIRPIVEDDRNNKWDRGGYVCFKCDIHRDEDRYCYCQVTEDIQTFMIQCDR